MVRSPLASRERALIIGAGPAGLTAAYELLTRTDIKPTVLELTDGIGGLSRTVNYKGNRIDIGGHRFFSKSERVMKWWLDMLPLESIAQHSHQIAYRGQTATVCTHTATPGSRLEDRVMLLRSRTSRIYFERQLFGYPLQLNWDTLRKLGFTAVVRIGLSYIHALAFPIQNQRNLEQFLINRFGRELYLRFFKAYTEKVWGVPCSDISAEWGAQRIKSLSLLGMLRRTLEKFFGREAPDLAQLGVETSLIERFLYPKFGPGQMWEEAASRIRSLGGAILMNWRVDKLEHIDTRVVAVHATNTRTNESRRFEAEYVFSTMPVKELIAAMNPPAPSAIREISDGLCYREFITVGVLCKRLKLRDPAGHLVKDNWIYIQDPNVLVGRLQIFNNWSPALVADPSTTWIGLEYFCGETEELWLKNDDDIAELAISELVFTGILDRDDVLDTTVIRMPKAYPAYIGTYNRFSEISSWSDRFENLFLIGRNGMHRYNNQDHSMLAAMTAVDNIIANTRGRENLWTLNAEQEYHEQKYPNFATT
jgi:protoporphyrinogen oxidase